MSFFDDSGIAPEQHRGQVIGALAVFGEQIERMVAVNIAWAATLSPAALALAVPAVPTPVRAVLVIISSLALVPATGILYSLAARAVAGEQVSSLSARTAVREVTRASLQALTPLFALLCALVWTAVLVDATGSVAVTVSVRALILLLLVTATYWGPILVARPQSSALVILVWSAWLVWRYPGRTLKTCLAVLALTVLSVFTVAGAVLVAPMLAALLHTNLFERLETEPGRV